MLKGFAKINAKEEENNERIDVRQPNMKKWHNRR